MQLAPLPPQDISPTDVDEIFAGLGWPTLTDLASRSTTQAPFSQRIFWLTVEQYSKLGFGPDATFLRDEPLFMIRETLQKA